jgi:DNA-binding LacI/PurR family transcriptional regulator
MRRLGLLGAPFPGMSDVLAGVRSAWGEEQAPELLWAETRHRATLDALVDGWVLLHHEGPDILPSLISGGRPVVGRSEEYERCGIPVVRTPDLAAGTLLGHHFASTCSGRLVFVGLRGRTFSDRRARAFRAACKSLGRAAEELNAMDWPGVVAALADAPTDSGFVGWADSAAYRLIDDAQRAGRRVPDDIAIGGIDNAPLPTDISLPLTTVSLDLQAHGHLIGSTIRNLAAGAPVPHVQDSPVGRLFVRASAPRAETGLPSSLLLS